ncbi:MAG: hypothetical protein HYZ68_00985 [Chloroflexi bacterium]|nr:hypothetical protein [Chloroflexota bacterium]
MDSLLGYLVPHAPLLLEEQEERRVATRSGQALARIRYQIERFRPDAILIASTHWCPPGPFLVDLSTEHHSFADYVGSKPYSYSCPGHPQLGRELLAAGRRAGREVDSTQDRGLDHGHFVPLCVLVPRTNIPVIPLSTSRRFFEECLRWGEVIAEMARATQQRLVFLASGDLSHCPPQAGDGFNNPFGPAGGDADEGEAFDSLALEYLCAGRGENLWGLDPLLFARATPEAELRHVFMLLGAVGAHRSAHLLSYERLADGIGMAILSFT